MKLSGWEYLGTLPATVTKLVPVPVPVPGTVRSYGTKCNVKTVKYQAKIQTFSEHHFHHRDRERRQATRFVALTTCKTNKMVEQALATKEGTNKEGDSFSRLEVR